MDEQKPERRKGGRPRKYASDERRPTLTFRVRGDMHERLLASAQQHERSLSEEVERILGLHFDQRGDDIRAIVKEELVRYNLVAARDPRD